jgi:hypothetical protein
VFTVSYSGRDSEYSVEGTAYDPDGNEHARWHSEEPASFSRDGRSMTYLWSGDLLGRDNGRNPDRSGFARLRLSSTNGGTGRVDHVAEKATLYFNVQRVTETVVAEWRAATKPEALADPNIRDQFARFYVRRLAAPASASPATLHP